MEAGLSRERLEDCNADLSTSLAVQWGILEEGWTLPGVTWGEIGGVLHHSLGY